MLFLRLIFAENQMQEFDRSPPDFFKNRDECPAAVEAGARALGDCLSELTIIIPFTGCHYFFKNESAGGEYIPHLRFTGK